jgi:hypothetical protein
MKSNEGIRREKAAHVKRSDEYDVAEEVEKSGLLAQTQRELPGVDWAFVWSAFGSALLVSCFTCYCQEHRCCCPKITAATGVRCLVGQKILRLCTAHACAAPLYCNTAECWVAVESCLLFRIARMSWRRSKKRVECCCTTSGATSSAACEYAMPLI